MGKIIESKSLENSKHELQATDFGRQMAAQAWCTLKTDNISIIPELAEAFARIIDELLSKPWLGNATTRELLQELTTRIEIDGRLDYRTSARYNGVREVREVRKVSE